MPPESTPGEDLSPFDDLEAQRNFPLLAVGCSAGSLNTLAELVRGLPTDLPVAVLVCQHTSQHGRSNLPAILARRGPLPASWAEDGERLEPGRIYVAPPAQHLMVQDHWIRLWAGPRVNRHRPSADVLFASVAQSVGPAATVLVLSGVLDDGAVGSALVDQAGGQVLVQDPAAAEFSGMPSAALAAAPNAQVVPNQSMSDYVVKAVRNAQDRMARPMTDADEEVGMGTENANQDWSFLRPDESQLVRLACPDCGGGLAQVDLPQISYFRCHVGHQYGPQSLVAALAAATETKLWSAVAALEEEAILQNHLENLPTAPTDEPTGPTTGGRRASHLWARAAELREQVQRWTGSDPSSDGPPSDQSSADDPS